MYNYRSKCRWNMLLHIDGEIVEIRPGELFKSKSKVTSRYLEVIATVAKTPKKDTTPKRKPKAEKPLVTFEDISDGSSST